MTEHDEAAAARQKAAIEAMKHAKSNMATVLERVDTLERALRNARDTIGELKGFIAPSAHTYPISGTSRKCTDIADDAVAAIQKVL